MRYSLQIIFLSPRTGADSWEDIPLGRSASIPRRMELGRSRGSAAEGDPPLSAPFPVSPVAYDKSGAGRRRFLWLVSVLIPVVVDVLHVVVVLQEVDKIF